MVFYMGELDTPSKLCNFLKTQAKEYSLELTTIFSSTNHTLCHAACGIHLQMGCFCYQKYRKVNKEKAKRTSAGKREPRTKPSHKGTVSLLENSAMLFITYGDCVSTSRNAHRCHFA
jgi:hypothetical protein